MNPNLDESMSQDGRLAAILDKLNGIIDWERRDRSHMRVEVAPTKDLLHRVGDPQKSFRSIHVTGTKGKGSVCAMLEGAIGHAGISVGRYSSPHVQRITERVTFDGVEIDEELLAATLEAAWEARQQALLANSPGKESNWFDILTVAAFLAFSQKEIEWAVVEVGIGGLFDSTNVLDSDVSVITNVELEHTALLGSTRAEIARQKLGILKPGSFNVSGVSANDDIGEVIETATKSLGSQLVSCPPMPEEPIRHSNARLAGAVLDILGTKGVRSKVAVTKHAAGSALGSWLLDDATVQRARLPGRMERLDVLRTGFDQGGAERAVPVILDGAHVPFNLAAVIRDLSLIEELRDPMTVVFGLGRDKNAQGMLSILQKNARAVIFPAWSGGFPTYQPNELVPIAEALGMHAEISSSPIEALSTAFDLVGDRGWIFVTGSLHLIGELRPTLLKKATRL